MQGACCPLLLRRGLVLTAAALVYLTTVGTAGAAPRGKPDLVAAKLSARVANGVAAIVVTDEVRNAGLVRSRRTTVRYLLSLDRRANWGDIPLGAGRKLAPLRPGKKSRSRRTLAPRVFLSSEPYFVLVCADPFDRVAEGRERNNCGTTRRPLPLGRSVLSTLGPPALKAHPASVTNARAARFELGHDAADVVLECRLDAAAFGPCPTVVTYGGLAEGDHEFVARARDRLGRTGRTGGFSWRVDVTPPPTPAIVSRPPALTRDTAATIGFASPGDGMPRCRLDSGAFAPCASPAALNSLTDGPHTFAVKAVDAAGNESAAATAAWTVDTTGPAPPQLVEAPTHPTNRTEARISFTTEPGATLACAFDAGPFAACSSPWERSGLLDGAHTFHVKATDALGNESAVRSHTWTVDTAAPPTPVLTTKPNALTNSRQATFAFTGPEGFRCSLDGVSSSCTSPRTYTGLGGGVHVFSVRARDAAGNESAAVAHSWTIDLIAPPAPVLSAVPANPTTERTATFGFSVADAAATLRCTLDGVVANPCTSPYTRAAPPLADGLHRFSVEARDPAGNLGPAATHSWFVENTPPATGLDTGVFTGPPSSVAAFELWLGRPVTRVLDYFDWTTWASIIEQSQIEVWTGSGYSLVYSVPILTTTGTTLEAGALGHYDHYWVRLAQRLVAIGQEDVVLRLGWEFNGDWYPWSAKGKEDAFKAYWRRIVNAMRSVPGSDFEFDWSSNFGPSRMPADTAYPGDAYVDYIGMSLFDQDWYPGWDNPVTRWRNFVTLPYGLQWQYDFARAHGKPVVFDEWGVSWREDGHGGGDAPYYVEKMYQWFNATDAAWALYFESDKEDGFHRLTTNPTRFPNAAARFKELFGS